MAWRRPGDKPLSKPMMVSLLTHICVTRSQWVNTSRDKIVAISQTEFSDAFSFNKNILISLRMSLKFDPKIPSNNIQALVQIMVWHRPIAIRCIFLITNGHYVRKICIYGKIPALSRGFSTVYILAKYLLTSIPVCPRKLCRYDKRMRSGLYHELCCCQIKCCTYITMRHKAGSLLTLIIAWISNHMHNKMWD